MEKAILKLLKENSGHFISGEDISRGLKVSRSAIWKHIQLLRENGYEIEAQPHLGYRLLKIPDLMLADEITYNLGNKILGIKILSYASAASTNEIAYSLAEQSAPEGTLVISEEQTKGKGRLGRRWVSPAKTGVYMSIILRPKISPVEAGKITLMCSMSIAMTIRSMFGLEALIKWPNDVFIDNEKVCGILTEMNAEQDLISFIILGIGVNVNTEAEKLPEGATSLKIKLKKKVDRIEFVRNLLKDLEENYIKINSEGFASIIGQWRDLSMTLGRRIKIKWRENIIEGQAMDVDENGALIVRDDFGFSHQVLSGDVTVVR